MSAPLLCRELRELGYDYELHNTRSRALQGEVQKKVARKITDKLSNLTATLGAADVVPGTFTPPSSSPRSLSKYMYLYQGWPEPGTDT